MNHATDCEPERGTESRFKYVTLLINHDNIVASKAANVLHDNDRENRGDERSVAFTFVVADAGETVTAVVELVTVMLTMLVWRVGWDMLSTTT